MPDSDERKTKKFIEDDFDLGEFKKKALILKYENFKEKNKNLVRLLSFLIAVLAFAIAYFTYQILDYHIGLWRNERIREKALNIVQVQTPAPPQPTTPLPTRSPQAPTLAPADTASTDRPILPEITELRQTFSNEDIVGYLKIEGTNIDYAVVQGADNQYYLTRDLYARDNAAGSIFVDYENNLKELDDNTVIYGHNMGNGSMFHNLRYYADEQYYEAHPYVSFVTPYEKTSWEIFSFYRTDTDFYYIQTSFANKNSFSTLLSQMKEKSMYDTGIPVDTADKILTLSTCTNASNDTRYVLNAKLSTDDNRRETE